MPPKLFWGGLDYIFSFGSNRFSDGLEECSDLFQPAETLPVFTVTRFYVQRSVKSNRLQLLVGLRRSKHPPARRILFEHPLLTVINVHINTRRADRKRTLFSRGQRTVVTPPQKTPQTACLIAHQLTMQPFVVPGKTHSSMCTHTHSLNQAGLRGLCDKARVWVGKGQGRGGGSVTTKARRVI